MGLAGLLPEAMAGGVSARARCLEERWETVAVGQAGKDCGQAAPGAVEMPGAAVMVRRFGPRAGGAVRAAGAAVTMRQVWGEGWRSGEGGGCCGDDAASVGRGMPGAAAMMRQGWRE
ncbi:hypothetical protein STA1M1_06290 [Sinisalibacter aestuarii]|uniref:Uncharacterized protein n=1 Tax=Sinisalibacter aestuarii TaxID=2949426 RepID=A0ABQ5LP34_9RHOB|nr:hypothetical protein STA1M1_06290 [Sinisalibacter aestuarii]